MYLCFIGNTDSFMLTGVMILEMRWNNILSRLSKTEVESDKDFL